ncbi:YveK family protein [Phycicoccus flavus]|uniref:hypothetical protein n=1 Tax=Phycicoccus flavus TaxID=2502783 RepID=UPI000FEB6693|nr:hypothetical protein [Phycicoccus flavus]NHA66591.1 hypothetical protein [Phycicoccus flavus]
MLRRRILTSAVVGLLLALAAGVLGQAYASGLPDEYTASTVVIFGSRPTENGSVSGSDSVQSAAAGYVAFLSAPATLREVAEGIGEDSAALKDGLSVTQLPATATIRIDFETTDPDRAARGANALASAVSTRTVSDPVVYAQVLARAAVPLRPSGPPRGILLGATVLVAVVVGVGAATATWVLSGLLLRRRPDLLGGDAAGTTEPPDRPVVGPGGPQPSHPEEDRSTDRAPSTTAATGAAEPTVPADAHEEPARTEGTAATADEPDAEDEAGTEPVPAATSGGAAKRPSDPRTPQRAPRRRSSTARTRKSR